MLTIETAPRGRAHAAANIAPKPKAAKPGKAKPAPPTKFEAAVRRIDAVLAAGSAPRAPDESDHDHVHRVLGAAERVRALVFVHDEDAGCPGWVLMQLLPKGQRDARIYETMSRIDLSASKLIDAALALPTINANVLRRKVALGVLHPGSYADVDGNELVAWNLLRDVASTLPPEANAIWPGWSGPGEDPFGVAYDLIGLAERELKIKSATRSRAPADADTCLYPLLSEHALATVPRVSASGDMAAARAMEQLRALYHEGTVAEYVCWAGAWALVHRALASPSSTLEDAVDRFRAAFENASWARAMVRDDQVALLAGISTDAANMLAGRLLPAAGPAR